MLGKPTFGTTAASRTPERPVSAHMILTMALQVAFGITMPAVKPSPDERSGSGNFSTRSTAGWESTVMTCASTRHPNSACSSVSRRRRVSASLSGAGRSGTASI